VEPQRRLIWTDGLGPLFRPSVEAFMAAKITMGSASDGRATPRLYAIKPRRIEQSRKKWGSSRDGHLSKRSWKILLPGVGGPEANVRWRAHRPDSGQSASNSMPGQSISPQKHTATAQPGRETLEVSEFFRSLLRSDTQAGPTRRCPPDGYGVSSMRVSQCNERWRTWEGSTARSRR
jgi:hypothetical protein